MKDSLGKEVQVGDIVIYGVRTNTGGSRGAKKLGTITDIRSGGLVKVDTDYVAMKSQSFIKVTPNFAQLWETNKIYDI